MIRTGDHLVSRVENLHERIVVALVDLYQIGVAWRDGNTHCGGLRSAGFQGPFDDRRSTECSPA
jgi:hypothetical protein